MLSSIDLENKTKKQTKRKSTIVDLRDSFLESLWCWFPERDVWRNRAQEDDFLMRLLFDEGVLPGIAKLIYDVGCVFHGHKVRLPSDSQTP